VAIERIGSGDLRELASEHAGAAPQVAAVLKLGGRVDLGAAGDPGVAGSGDLDPGAVRRLDLAVVRDALGGRSATPKATGRRPGERSDDDR